MFLKTKDKDKTFSSAFYLTKCKADQIAWTFAKRGPSLRLEDSSYSQYRVWGCIPTRITRRGC